MTRTIPSAKVAGYRVLQARRVERWLRTQADSDGFAALSLRQGAKHVGTDYGTFCKALRDLIAAGIVEKVATSEDQTEGRGSVYRLT
jgi:hypothetical protein